MTLKESAGDEHRRRPREPVATRKVLARDRPVAITAVGALEDQEVGTAEEMAVGTAVGAEEDRVAAKVKNRPTAQTRWHEVIS